MKWSSDESSRNQNESFKFKSPNNCITVASFVKTARPSFATNQKNNKKQQQQQQQQQQKT